LDFDYAVNHHVDAATCGQLQYGLVRRQTDKIGKIRGRRWPSGSFAAPITAHDLPKVLENMQRLDTERGSADEPSESQGLGQDLSVTA
jgi:hypothetical protein